MMKMMMIMMMPYWNLEHGLTGGVALTLCLPGSLFDFFFSLAFESDTDLGGWQLV